MGIFSAFLQVIFYALFLYPPLVLLIFKKRAAWIVVTVEAAIGTMISLFVMAILVSEFNHSDDLALAIPFFLAPIFILGIAIYGIVQWKPENLGRSRYNPQDYQVGVLDDLMPPPPSGSGNKGVTGFIPFDFNRDKLGILSLPVIIVGGALFIIFRGSVSFNNGMPLSIYFYLYSFIWITFLWAKRRASAWIAFIVLMVCSFLSYFLFIQDIMNEFMGLGGDMFSRMYMSTILTMGLFAFGAIIISIFGFRKWHNGAKTNASIGMI